MSALRRLAFASFVLALSASLAVGVGDSPARGERASIQVADCAGRSLATSVVTSAPTYRVGQVVRATASIRNTSSTVCHLGVGPSTPSMVITDARGRVVWNTCYVADQPGACAQWLMMRPLTPGVPFTRTLAWDQGLGVARTRVAPGPYRLAVAWGPPGAADAVTFYLLARGARTHVVALAANGSTLRVRVGDEVVVRLAGPAIYRWTAPSARPLAPLLRLRATSGVAGTATFVARAPGWVSVRSVGSPACYPQCLMPSRLFDVRVVVAR